LFGDLTASKRLFARRIELARAANHRDRSRDDADYSMDFGRFSREWLSPRRYCVLLELAHRERRVTGMLDFNELDDYENAQSLTATVPQDLLGNTPLDVAVGDDEENPLRISVMLMRRSDQRLLVLGDNLAIRECSGDAIEFEPGSSPVSDMTDKVLSVVAHEPLMGLGIDHEDDHRLNFRHRVVWRNLAWDRSRQHIKGFKSIDIGMFGARDDMRSRTVLAAWERIADWK